MAEASSEAKACKFCYLFNINEGLVLLKLANTVLILINTGPSNVKVRVSNTCSFTDYFVNKIKKHIPCNSSNLFGSLHHHN